MRLEKIQKRITDLVRHEALESAGLFDEATDQGLGDKGKDVLSS